MCSCELSFSKLCVKVCECLFVKLTALFSISVQKLSLTLFSALFLCLFVFCMLNLAYSGLVLFGKFLYLSFVFWFCNNVIFLLPVFKAVLECVLLCYAFLFSAASFIFT